MSFVVDSPRIVNQRVCGGYSNSSGEKAIESFGVEDLSIAAIIAEESQRLQGYKEFRDDYQKMPIVMVQDQPKVYNSPYHYRDQGQTQRIERSLNVLKMARSQSFLPLKISLFISVLECLFTTDNSEVTHKVSERVSFYLNGDFATRLANYTAIKEAYDLRSKFFHVQPIKKGKREDLKKVSNNIDSILRQVMTKVILEDFDKFMLRDTNLIHEYFTTLIFSAKS